jgi:hypothetical protein
MEDTARLREIVKEEYAQVREKAEKAYPKIKKELESMRKKLMKEMTTRESLGQTTTSARKEKRVQLDMVADIVGVGVNELMLYFLNCIKASNERHLVEYRLGHVYFYDDE